MANVWGSNQHGSKATLRERFTAKVDQRGPDECWPWTGALNSDGYGIFRLTGKTGGLTTAHRVAYELEYGPLPDGTEPDHTCERRDCENPAHLEAVTHRENCLRRFARARAARAAA